MKLKAILFVMSGLFSGCVDVVDKSDAYGNFEAETVIVSSETSGKILQFNVEKGMKIDAGFPAAIVDTIPFYLEIKQVEAQQAVILAKRQTVDAQIAIFEEQKKNLQTDETRIVQMLADGAATQKQFDEITGQIRVIDKQTESTKTQFTSIRKELDLLETRRASIADQMNRCKVAAPAGGTVLETYAEEGELVTAGRPLFKIANLEVITLKAYVSGAQLPNIKLGQEVSVLTDETKTGNRVFPGKITWISGEAEFTPKIIQTKEERVKLVYAIKIEVKNDGTIKIGMPGEVRWNLPSDRSAIK